MPKNITINLQERIHRADRAERELLQAGRNWITARAKGTVTHEHSIAHGEAIRKLNKANNAVQKARKKERENA